MSGCKDDEKVEPEKSIERWVENENYTGRNKVQLNSKSFDDAMYTYGVGYYTVFKKSEEIRNYIVSQNSYSILQRPPLSENFLIEITVNNDIFIKPGDLNRSFKLFFDIEEFDSTFFQYEPISYFHNESILTNKLDQILISYRGKTRGQTTTKYVLLSINDNRTTVTAVPILTILRRPGAVWSEVNNNFYVSDGESTYKIKPDGSSKLVFDRVLFRMFEHADIVWSVGLDGLVFYSKDNGDSWLRFGESENFYWSKLNFRQINNEVIAYFKSQIYHFVIDENDAGQTMINAREIVSDGLESNEITSISFFDKKYYVTTFSGVFTKSEESFFTYGE